MRGKCLLLLQLLCAAVVGCGAATGGYYTAGVVEFRPAVSGGSSEQLLEENLAAYLELIEAANGTADILIFPEGTLNSQLQLTAVPAPSRRSLCPIVVAPVDGVATFLRQLACAAVAAQSYLVLNVKERERCDREADCPARGYRLYNTNVVLDRSGAVVSRYRKWNLYLEPQLNRTKEPEYAIFETDFNVTFGHFICFDMLFYTPAQELVERYSIQHLIVTKMFNSELPFLTASQFQQGWAWANNVNLLAAGASLPHGGISGSGIYAGRRGALVRRMVGDTHVGQRQLLLARVPRYSQSLQEQELELDEERAGPAQRQLVMLQQPQLEDFASWLVPLLNGSRQHRRLCQQDLCCDFELQLELPSDATQQPEYSYRAGVFVGQRRYEEEQYSVVRLCGLFACRNESILSCGQLAAAPAEEPAAGSRSITFSWLRIRGEFVRRQRRLLMPSTLSAALYALQATEFEWAWQDDTDIETASTHVELGLSKSHSELLTFGIYGNYFDEFADDDKPGGGEGGGGDGARGMVVAKRGQQLLMVLLMLLLSYHGG
ncbi:PREDICTED: vanin-like protein 3 isoform X2 [Drosophila arizonae]|uniref:Vanin-like protein 3 isoform X2 n=1 Tax=Drosophila arizonae TaxID=7263 RepID=A0ABM1PX41_DROAR|nr:PREDICTED: vanin-like protein 3 isoform X2 [Drosophila arizonae]